MSYSAGMSLSQRQWGAIVQPRWFSAGTKTQQPKEEDKKENKKEDRKEDKKEDNNDEQSTRNLNWTALVSASKWTLAACLFYAGVRGGTLAVDNADDQLEAMCLTRIELVRDQIGRQDTEDPITELVQYFTGGWHMLMTTFGVALLDEKRRIKIIAATLDIIREILTSDEISSEDHQLAEQVAGGINNMLIMCPADTELRVQFLNTQLLTVFRVYPAIFPTTMDTHLTQLFSAIFRCDTARLLDDKKMRMQLMLACTELSNNISEPQNMARVLDCMAVLFNHCQDKEPTQPIVPAVLEGGNADDDEDEARGDSTPAPTTAGNDKWAALRARRPAFFETEEQMEKNLLETMERNVFTAACVEVFNWEFDDDDVDALVLDSLLRSSLAAARALDQGRIKASIYRPDFEGLEPQSAWMHRLLEVESLAIPLAALVAAPYGMARASLREWYLRRRDSTRAKRRVWLRGGLRATTGAIVLTILGWAGEALLEAEADADDEDRRLWAHIDPLCKLFLARYTMVFMPYAVAPFCVGGLATALSHLDLELEGAE